MNNHCKLVSEQIGLRNKLQSSTVSKGESFSELFILMVKESENIKIHSNGTSNSHFDLISFCVNPQILRSKQIHSTHRRLELNPESTERVDVRCVGTVLSDRHVLTSGDARCLFPSENQIMAVLVLQTSGPSKAYTLRRLFRYPDMQHDIVILEINDRFDLTVFASQTIGTLELGSSCKLFALDSLSINPRPLNVTINESENCEHTRAETFCVNFPGTTLQCTTNFMGTPLVCGDEGVVNGIVVVNACTTFLRLFLAHNIGHVRDWINGVVSGEISDGDDLGNGASAISAKNLILLAAFLTSLRKFL
ncbi:CLUMA_CG016967, isoform A [Clunio marinus]|uniref:CLUMA_CG016967, isoform A n=1 Tax=Clunio marinus TaxID=568069 RepID=A0A1J1IVS3_9DIPT|nr:CLUMA_CG016967, isoform A [Clunio marinus]